MFRKKSYVKSTYYSGNMCLSAIVWSAEKKPLESESDIYHTVLSYFSFG